MTGKGEPVTDAEYRKLGRRLWELERRVVVDKAVPPEVATDILQLLMEGVFEEVTHEGVVEDRHRNKFSQLTVRLNYHRLTFNSQQLMTIRGPFPEITFVIPCNEKEKQ